MKTKHMTEKELTDALCSVSHKILALQLQFKDLKDARMKMRRQHTESRHGLTTIYEVRESKVRSHTRRAYRALRVTVRRGQ